MLDDSQLITSGWTRPERFVAKGCDGQTDIYAESSPEPSNFDPQKRYPVVEEVYAGPQIHLRRRVLGFCPASMR